MQRTQRTHQLAGRIWLSLSVPFVLYTWIMFARDYAAADAHDRALSILLLIPMGAVDAAGVGVLGLVALLVAHAIMAYRSPAPTREQHGSE